MRANARKRPGWRRKRQLALPAGEKSRQRHADAGDFRFELPASFEIDVGHIGPLDTERRRKRKELPGKKESQGCPRYDTAEKGKPRSLSFLPVPFYEEIRRDTDDQGQHETRRPGRDFRVLDRWGAPP